MAVNMKKSIIILAAASLMFASCNFLNLTPESQLTGDQYFRTAEDLQLFTNTFYNNLLDKTPYGIESDVFVSRNPSNLIRGGNDRTVPASGGGWSWTDLRKMNTLLGNLDKCSDANAVQEYSALTKFWRAYFYFEKVKRFGDVPWIDRELGSSDEALYNARDSRETIMQHMIEDIDEAIANLPEPAAAPQTAYRVNKYTAMFLKAQFCLYEGTFRKYYSEPAPFSTSYTGADGSTHDADWYLQMAVDAAEMFMEQAPYKLHSTGHPESDYLALFTTEETFTDEMILAVNYDRDLKIKHDCTRELTNQTSSRLGMTKKLVDQYLMKDGSRFTDKEGWQTMPFEEEVADRDPRLAQTIRTPGYTWEPGKKDGPEFKFCQTGYQSIKYVMSYESKAYSTDNSFNDMPVYRLAELYLNFAEAKAELGTLTQGDLDRTVNLIRERVGMPGIDLAWANAHPDPYLLSEETGYPNVSGANAGIILELRRERAIELFEEGYGRYFDLMRWKAGYAINQPMYGMYIPGPGEYVFGDKSKYVFFVGSTSSKNDKMEIYNGEVKQDLTYLVNPETGEFDTKGVMKPMQTIGVNFDETKHYFFPLPEKDLQLNENLVQNPNWK